MTQPNCSVILEANQSAPYSVDDFSRMLESLGSQYRQNFEVIVYGDRTEVEKPVTDRGYLFVQTSMESKSKALNEALKKASGESVLICQTAENVVTFKKSATSFYEIMTGRRPEMSLLYSDYDIMDEGVHKERKLLEWHPGRLLDTWDMGYCLLFKGEFLRDIGYCDEQYQYNPIYDLRLKAFETERVVHISNRFNGVPYIVQASEQSHDVFAYLKAGKAVAKELETICTEHLKRIDAYLAPGQNYHTVSYSNAEEESFETIASVVIPVFNRPEFIGHAIESVQAQTVQNIECVVVCNGGEDDPTVDAVKAYMQGGEKYDPDKPAVRLVVHDMNNLGLCFNSALQTSKSKYYMQLDSDDLLFENAIEKILKVYDTDDRIGMVIGTYQVFEKQDDGSVEPVLVDGKPFVVDHDEWTEENGRNNLLRVGGAGAPRSVKIKALKDIGWFGMNDAPYCRNYAEDYEVVNKIAEKYRIGRVWEPVYKVVRHAGGTDHNIDQVTIDVNDNAKDHMRLVAIRRRQQIKQK